MVWYYWPLSVNLYGLKFEYYGVVLLASVCESVQFRVWMCMLFIFIFFFGSDLFLSFCIFRHF